MKNRGGHTLLELIVASGVLLVMVFMTTTAVVSYVHAYHQYTEKGLRVRQAAKLLEAVTQHLRSADAIQEMDTPSHCTDPFTYGERGVGLRALLVADGTLFVENLDVDHKVTQSTRIGATRGITLTQVARTLHITLQVEDAPPLETEISLRGVETL